MSKSTNETQKILQNIDFLIENTIKAINYKFYASNQFSQKCKVFMRKLVFLDDQLTEFSNEIEGITKEISLLREKNKMQHMILIGYREGFIRTHQDYDFPLKIHSDERKNMNKNRKVMRKIKSFDGVEETYKFSFKTSSIYHEESVFQRTSSSNEICVKNEDSVENNNGSHESNDYIENEGINEHIAQLNSLLTIRSQLTSQELSLMSKSMNRQFFEKKQLEITLKKQNLLHNELIEKNNQMKSVLNELEVKNLRLQNRNNELIIRNGYIIKGKELLDIVNEELRNEVREKVKRIEYLQNEIKSLKQENVKLYDFAIFIIIYFTLIGRKTHHFQETQSVS